MVGVVRRKAVHVIGAVTNSVRGRKIAAPYVKVAVALNRTIDRQRCGRLKFQIVRIKHGVSPRDIEFLFENSADFGGHGSAAGSESWNVNVNGSEIKVAMLSVTGGRFLLSCSLQHIWSVS